jgi:hypothetical protein
MDDKRYTAGLASNVGLTVTKGVAGIYMNSASLLAEAGHSLSDLLGVSPHGHLLIIPLSYWISARGRADELNLFFGAAGFCHPGYVEDFQETAFRRVSLGLWEIRDGRYVGGQSDPRRRRDRDRVAFLSREFLTETGKAVAARGMR